MPVGARRSDIEIIRDILRMHPGRITELRYSVNLSHSQLQKYLSFLEQAELIRMERQSSKVVNFRVTPKGRRVLGQMERLFNNLGIESHPEIRSHG